MARRTAPRAISVLNLLHRIAGFATAAVLATALAGTIGRADVRSLAAGGAQIEISGVHYDMLKAGTLLRRDSCVSLGLVADSQPPYASREMCSCPDGSGFGEQPQSRRIVFIGKQQWCPGRPPPPGNLTGTWQLVCCNGKYSMSVNLTEAGGSITGSFADGSTVTGARSGNRVTFRRNIPGYGVQDYTLTVSPDSRRLTGTFTGRRDESVGVDTVMTR